MGRGCQAKHDSAAPASLWGSPLAFVTIKAGGPGQLSAPPQDQRPRVPATEPHPKGQTWPGTQRGQPPNAASKEPGNSAQQSSDHGVLPREPGQLELRPPPSGLGLREQDGAPVLNDNSGQQIKTPLVGVSMRAGSLVPSQGILGGQGHCSGVNPLLLSKRRACGLVQNSGNDNITYGVPSTILST